MTSRFIAQAALCSCALGAPALAQATVPFSDPSWKDFGATAINSVAGNFHPGWTTINATPDLGPNPFGYPAQTLSGAPDDSGLWFNEWGAGNGQNEVARLSLSGFSIGQAYSLTFSATLMFNSFVGWDASLGMLDVSLSGADISSFQTTMLSDAGDADGMNDWNGQTISFTANASTVEFDFGGGAVVDDPMATVSRFSVNGFDARVVPAPGAIALLAGAAPMLGLRRRRGGP